MREAWKTRAARWARDGAMLIALLVVFHACQTSAHPRGPAPRFEALALDGGKVAIGAPSGEPVVLHFWATWCGVCRAEQGNVEILAGRANVITVASRSGPSADVQRYLDARASKLRVINDPNGTLAAKYEVHAFPSTFFLDRDGRIVTSEVGYTTTLGLLARQWWAGL